MLAPVERAPTTRRGVGGRARAGGTTAFGDPVPPANRTFPVFEPEPRVSRGRPTATPNGSPSPSTTWSGRPRHRRAIEART